MAFIEVKDLKIMLFVALIGTVIAVGITLAVMLPKKIAARALEKEQSELAALQSNSISITEFVIPPEFKNVWQESWYPYRGMTPVWSRDQAKKYIENPQKLTEEILSKENERKIEALLGRAP